MINLKYSTHNNICDHDSIITIEESSGLIEMCSPELNKNLINFIKLKIDAIKFYTFTFCSFSFLYIITTNNRLDYHTSQYNSPRCFAAMSTSSNQLVLRNNRRSVSPPIARTTQQTTELVAEVAEHIDTAAEFAQLITGDGNMFKKGLGLTRLATLKVIPLLDKFHDNNAKAAQQNQKMVAKLYPQVQIATYELEQIQNAMPWVRNAKIEADVVQEEKVILDLTNSKYYKNRKFNEITGQYQLNANEEVNPPLFGRLNNMTARDNVIRRVEEKFGLNLGLMNSKIFIENIIFENENSSNSIRSRSHPTEELSLTSKFVTRGDYRVLIQPISVPGYADIPQIPTSLIYTADSASELATYVINHTEETQQFNINQKALISFAEKTSRPARLESSNNQIELLRRLSNSVYNKFIILQNLLKVLSTIDNERLLLMHRNYPYKFRDKHTFFEYFKHASPFSVPMLHSGNLQLELENILKLEFVFPGTVQDLSRGYNIYAHKLELLSGNKAIAFSEAIKAINEKYATDAKLREKSIDMSINYFNTTENTVWKFLHHKHTLLNQMFNLSPELKKLQGDLLKKHGIVKDFNSKHLESIKSSIKMADSTQNLTQASAQLDKLKKSSIIFNNSIIKFESLKETQSKILKLNENIKNLKQKSNSNPVELQELNELQQELSNLTNLTIEVLNQVKQDWDIYTK